MAQFQRCELPLIRSYGNDYYGPNHRLQIRGPAVKVQAKKAAYDVHDGRSLGAERRTQEWTSVLDVS